MAGIVHARDAGVAVWSLNPGTQSLPQRAEGLQRWLLRFTLLPGMKRLEPVWGAVDRAVDIAVDNFVDYLHLQVTARSP